MLTMPATIDSIATSYGSDSYYDEEFFIILDSFMPYLRLDTTNVKIVTPTNAQLYKYEGDFFGILDELGYAKQYHYAIMLFNGLRCTGDFNVNITSINIPNLRTIDGLQSTYSALSTTA